MLNSMNRSEFLSISCKCALALSYTGVFGEMIAPREGQDNELRLRCIAVFDRFEQVWKFNDFWKRGNTCDACLNFASAVQHRWPYDPEVRAMAGKVDAMLVENLQYFKT